MLSNAGDEYKLKAFAGQCQASGFVLKLFKNDFHPAKDSVRSNYLESDFVGYAPILLTPEDWKIEGKKMSIDIQVFTSTQDQALQEAYGWYLELLETKDVIMSDRFDDGPYMIEFEDQLIKVTTTAFG